MPSLCSSRLQRYIPIRVELNIPFKLCYKVTVFPSRAVLSVDNIHSLIFNFKLLFCVLCCLLHFLLYHRLLLLLVIGRVEECDELLHRLKC